MYYTLISRTSSHSQVVCTSMYVNAKSLCQMYKYEKIDTANTQQFTLVLFCFLFLNTITTILGYHYELVIPT